MSFLQKALLPIPQPSPIFPSQYLSLSEKIWYLCLWFGAMQLSVHLPRTPFCLVPCPPPMPRTACGLELCSVNVLNGNKERGQGREGGQHPPQLAFSQPPEPNACSRLGPTPLKSVSGTVFQVYSVPCPPSPTSVNLFFLLSPAH